MVDLVTDRLRIRPIVSGDAGSFELVLGDAEVMRFSDHGALSEREILSWVSQQVQDYATFPELGRRAITISENQTAIGYISLTQCYERTEKGELELGFRLARQHWGNGYALEAAQAMISYAFELTGTQRVIAIVDPNNLPSVLILAKLGMLFHKAIMLEGYDYPDKVYAISKSARFQHALT